MTIRPEDLLVIDCDFNNPLGLISYCKTRKIKNVYIAQTKKHFDDGVYSILVDGNDFTIDVVHKSIDVDANLVFNDRYVMVIEYHCEPNRQTDVQENKKYMLDVVVSDKYIVRQSLDGIVYALRNCEEWRDCVGDNLILAMAQRIEELQDELTEAQKYIIPPTSV